MIQEAILKLQYLCNIIPPNMALIDENTFSNKVSSERWSKKEILGHLIDSATINHHRFIRAQFEDCPIISYNQNLWNIHGFYQDIDSSQLIELWTIYNKQLLEIIKRIPQNKLFALVSNGDETYSLQFIINDYVQHLEHHLKQILNF